jgi:hypothetical protein
MVHLFRPTFFENNFMTIRKPFLLALALLLVPLLSRAQQADVSSWFPFRPENASAPGQIGMADWLDAPAGKHGVLEMRGGDFVFSDGTPIKFWGVNVASNKPYVEREEVHQWVDFLAKYGINSVRFHKFTSHALTGPTSTTLDTAKHRRMDYFHAQLRERGIYYGWSHIYGHKPRPGDRDRLLNYEEIANVKLPWAHLNATTASLVNFAPDLQDLSIELTVNMLTHRNPYTGLRYADDPALTFVELQNEDNIFWSAIEATLKQTPTYLALLNRQFSDWLRQKYGSQQALVAAWGAEALQPGEHLDQHNIYPKPNHSWFDAEFRQAAQEQRPIRQHYLDRARFLYETQMRFYDRFVAAVRATGYQGPIVASCWQAGSGLTHFYNLHADYATGIVDRHNYFGGGAGGHQMKPGAVRNGAMVAQPGSGLLSTGLQLVQGRPFAFSEWMSLIPNEWVAESAPIIATYGMGLQGWDASYSFALDLPHFTSTVQGPHGVYNVTSPTHLALYPALARMVYRGDVQPGQVVATRNVHLPSLAEGKLGFTETVEQGHDIKQFGGSTPAEALAAGKVEVAFTDTYTASPQPDLSAWWDQENKVVRSTTGQLAWHYGGKGFFTVNTPGTKGVVGFAGGQEQVLGEATIRVETPFAVVLLTSLEPGKSIRDAKRLLVTTVARARNTGMTYSADGTELLTVGEAPLLLEPVRAQLALRRRGRPQVHVLDHVGRRTGQTLPVRRGQVQLDGAESRAIYYELVY